MSFKHFGMKIAAYEQSKKVVVEFLYKNIQIVDLIEKTLSISNKGNNEIIIVIQVQNRWRSKLFLKKIRIKILTQLWESKVLSLQKMYIKGGKKQHGLANKLKKIKKEKRDEMLKTYYDLAKEKHIIMLGKWLKIHKGIITVYYLTK